MKRLLLLALLAPLLAFAKPDNAKSVLVYDYTTNTIREQVEIHRPVPIASVTKLMTVYAVLESRADLNEVITITKQPLERSKILRPGMKVTRKELINMSLIASDNLAAKMLAVAHPNGYEEFIKSMNSSAQRLGMNDTVFIEPTGLLPNVSTAWNLHLLNQALTKHPVFADSAMSKSITTDTQNKGVLKRFIIHNTSAFAGRYNIRVGKTGYTNPAGWCISMLVTHQGHEFDVIVLGSPNKATRNASAERYLKNIIN